jgi:integrase/recombinase XerD
MNTRTIGPPAFARSAIAYLRHHRALGLRFKNVEQLLRQLGGYLINRGAPDLDHCAYESWRQTRTSIHSNSRRMTEQIVRRFCLYRRRSEPTIFVPSADDLSPLKPYLRAVIIEPEQILRMMQIAAQLESLHKSPLRRAAARVAVVLLYTAGLRSGELLRLQVEDVEQDGAVLQIRESKFHKSRLVPLSESAQEEVRQYLKERTAFASRSAHRGPFLCHHRSGSLHPYSVPGFRGVLGELFRRAAVRDREGRIPRVHDIRHSFAVQSLIRSYRNHGDPQALLPKLALYMGHVSVGSTSHYLKLVPAVAALASARFEAAFAQRVLGDEP